MRRDVLGRVVVVLAAAGVVAAGCGDGAVAGGPPPGPSGITGTVTWVEPLAPRTEDCVEPGDRPPEAPVSSDDQPLCTDPGTDLVGSVLVDQHPDRQVAAPGPEPGNKAMVSVATGSRILRAAEGGHVEASFDDLEVGQLVEVWFDGPVAESYPVQARAEAVVILPAPGA